MSDMVSSIRGYLLGAWTGVPGGRASKLYPLESGYTPKAGDVVSINASGEVNITTTGPVFGVVMGRNPEDIAEDRKTVIATKGYIVAHMPSANTYTGQFKVSRPLSDVIDDSGTFVTECFEIIL